MFGLALACKQKAIASHGKAMARQGASRPAMDWLWLAWGSQQTAIALWPENSLDHKNIPCPDPLKIGLAAVLSNMAPDGGSYFRPVRTDVKSSFAISTPQKPHDTCQDVAARARVDSFCPP